MRRKKHKLRERKLIRMWEEAVNVISEWYECRKERRKEEANE